jgi:DNA primase
MNYDRLEFLDAVEELAKKAGMEVPRDQRAAVANPDSRDQYAALDAAAHFFQKQLEGSEKARAYFERRGVDADNRARFGLGYAPDAFDGLKNALGTDERRMQLLEKTGMFSRSDNGRVYDKFRDRVMFPIHDRRGRVIAFGGRVLDKEDGPKYLNSPETPLFHKGRELYGLWQVRQAHAKIPRLVVVEGYMDVVALFQYGVTQAVATLGTGDHARARRAAVPQCRRRLLLLRRRQGRARRGVEGGGVGAAAHARRPPGLLPVPARGRGSGQHRAPGRQRRFRGAAGAGDSLSDFFFAEHTREIKLDSLEGRARLAERAKPQLAQIPDGAFRDLMFQRLAELARLNAPAAAPAPAPAPPRRAPPRGAPPPKQSLVRAAITFLVQQPALADTMQPAAPVRRTAAAGHSAAGRIDFDRALAPGHRHRRVARTLRRPRGRSRAAEAGAGRTARRRQRLGHRIPRCAGATGPADAPAAHRRVERQAEGRRARSARER